LDRRVPKALTVQEMTKSVIVIGAGPAGLTAGYLLAKAKVPVVVIEADPKYVGGISRTVEYKGFHFDIGGHRFFSKSQEVEDFWTEILSEDLLVRNRLSHIYYGKKFFSYPLKPFEALLQLGLWRSMLCALSFIKARLLPIRDPATFEDWVSNQFGRRLFNIFFKTYTEKVWGIHCKEISADWAAQRIKDLSLWSVIWSALPFRQKSRNPRKMIKTLIHSFRYPRKGPGMMWEACTRKMQVLGGRLVMGYRVMDCRWNPQTALWSVSACDAEGRTQTFEGSDLISSAPLRELMAGLSPTPSAAALCAAKSLRYRDFLVVGLIVKGPMLFNDNWIYIHEPALKVGRIQNFKAWSPEMVPDPSYIGYGMEYFCFEGDGLWAMSDEDLITLASSELRQIGASSQLDIQDGCVIRQRKAYPIYDTNYLEHVAAIREEIDAAYPTLHVVGRNGMHKYNNQDHAMMTAMLTVRNILAGKRLWNPWAINQDAEYLEDEHQQSPSGASGLRQVPTPVARSSNNP
jgi:protoporphyrinogen oxidase